MTSDKNDGLERGSLSAPRKPRKRTDEICDRIKDWIVERDMQPGDRLPQEPDLIREFEASKGTVRESLKSLETQGLIKTRTGPGGGAFVADIDGGRAMELLANFFFFRQPTISDIYQLRRRLEPDLAVSVIGLLKDEDFKRLEDTLRLYDHPPENRGEEYEQRLAELDFHTVLAELCPNPLLGFFCGFLQNLLRNQTVCQHIYEKPNPELRQHALHYQLRLLQALKAGNAEAAREIMFEHMCAAQAYMESCEAEMKRGFLRVGDK
ncbi:FadR/GntR family transcriptional regulator [Aestuariispira insulae]|uniref:DNA-binding FadR family transcriptional regulator n=1 Tax=Aestuariispira insulae TaxID=1461337 RepID=A0A3D9H9G7_9PROT|nr:FCD domain-containing protein [Aestuariispira insulae]RED45821.1 DNA-binding FadR family transcriptional regulator [Aestuariispira insulae]